MKTAEIKKIDAIPYVKFSSTLFDGLVSNETSHLKPRIIARNEDEAIKTASCPAYSNPLIWVIKRFAKKITANGKKYISLPVKNWLKFKKYPLC